MARHKLWAAAAAVLLLHVAAQPIKHVVLLQLENRAFDHMLGWLNRNNSAINGLNNQYNYVDPRNTSSARVFVNDQGEYVDPDPGHSLLDSAQQIFGWDTNGAETMQGFIANAVNHTGTWAPHIMSCFKPQAVPVISTLAMEFTLIDNFFSAVPAETYPNRIFTLSGTSYGYVANDDDRTILGWPQKPIFAALDEASVDWRVYFDEVSTAWLFQYTRNAEQMAKFHTMDKFYTDVAAGNLSSFTYIDPAFFDFFGHNASDQHPSHDVVEGELLMKRVYEALRASPAWEETVLIVTYDEHGGFYDHVAPPRSGVPAPDNVTCVDCKIPFNFDRLGVRIPAIIVSPWVPKGQVIHAAPADVMPTPTSQMELSSIPATLRRVFNTPAFLTARDAWAVPLNWIWNSSYSGMTAPRTDCPTTLPAPPSQSPAFVGRQRLGINDMSALHKSLLMLSQSVSGLADSVEVANANVEKFGIDTEAEAGLFIKHILSGNDHAVAWKNYVDEVERQAAKHGELTAAA